MDLSLVVDIALSVITLLLVIKYTLKGFVKGVFDSFKVVLASVIAYLIRMPIARALDSWFMNSAIVNWVENSLLNSLKGEETFINLVELYKNAPLLFENVLVKFGLKDPSCLNNIESASDDVVHEVAVDLGSSISMLLSTTLAVIAVFIIAVIAISIVARLLDSLTKFSFIKVVNKLLGFVLGVVASLAVIWVTIYVLEFLVNTFGGVAPQVLNQEELNESMVFGIFRSIEFGG